ncbi:sugar ABC transporter permease [Kribbella turkmenica]|uniref:Sugar ABC transporter permease n=2 Tax=Kribbella turkmenica TaxID=2530375 RepID=A0A4R4X8T4_9ACTN|nr:sugar ABC transporter permease [Kribbella turkmenica]
MPHTPPVVGARKSLGTSASRFDGDQTGPPALVRTRRIAISDRSFGILLAAPAFALFVVIAVYPLVASIGMSVFDQTLLREGRSFVGLSNYAEVLSETFWGRLRTTVVFSLFATVAPLVIAVGAALLLNSRLRGRTILRGALMVPWILPSVVTSFLWAWIFNTNYGLLNQLLLRLGLTDGATSWLGDDLGAMAAVVVAKTWQSFPWMMAVTLAALQTVPAEHLEAAVVDGANRWQRFWHVTLPHISVAVGLVSLLEFIYNFGNFDTIFVMTGGGPGEATSTLALSVFDMAFQTFDLGGAAALGSLWLVVLGLISGAYLFLNHRAEQR